MLGVVFRARGDGARCSAREASAPGLLVRPRSFFVRATVLAALAVSARAQYDFPIDSCACHINYEPRDAALDHHPAAVG